jgi:hypothetical protein
VAVAVAVAMAMAMAVAVVVAVTVVVAVMAQIYRLQKHIALRHPHRLLSPIVPTAM